MIRVRSRWFDAADAGTDTGLKQSQTTGSATQTSMMPATETKEFI